MGDVIGGRKVVIREAPVLPSAMPYDRIVEGARYAALPAALQPTIAFGLGADILGTPLAQAQFPWAQLNNRKVTLSFRAATQADEDALHALLPEGDISDISQLPSSIPAYLIKVVPELKVEGEAVLAGAAMNLGEELAFRYSVRDPIHGLRHYPNKVVAGSYLAVAVVGGGVATGSLREAQARLEATGGALASTDDTLLAGLTREDLLGDMFYAGLLGYFAQYQALGHLSALSQSAHFQLATSAGTYGYVPQVSYFFGLPRAITPGGVEMDLDRVAHTSSVDGQGADAWRQFNFQLGALSSALEHAVPEQMFVTPANPGEAVSAVKALQLAAQGGQRVYHVNQANQAEALTNIRQNSLTMSEIRAALAVGKEVIVHTDPISVPGWNGAGYVIFDAETGAGAWKIGGGAKGSFFGDVGVGLWILLQALISNAENAALRALGALSQAIEFIGNVYSAITSCPANALPLVVFAIVASTLISVAFVAAAAAVGGVFAAIAASIFVSSVFHWAIGSMLNICRLVAVRSENESIAAAA